MLVYLEISHNYFKMLSDYLSVNSAKIFNLLKNRADVFILALLWSPSAVCLKIASNEIPTFSLLSICMSIAVLILTAATFLSKNSSGIDRKNLKHCFFLGFFCNGMPFILQTFAIHSIQTITVGIINALIPIITLVGAHYFHPKSKLSLSNVLGILFGFLGTFIIIILPSGQSEYSDEIFGILLSIASSCIYSFGLIYAGRINLERSLIYPTTHIASTLLYLIPLSILLDPPLIISDISPEAILSILILSIPSTSIAFILYYRILNKSTPSILSTVNFLLPLFKAALGVIILGEALNLGFLVSGGLIISGVLLTS